MRRAALTGAALALFLIFVYIFLPVGRINALIARTLSAQGLLLEPGAHKTVLPGLAWENGVIASDRGALVRFNLLRVRPLLLPMLSGKLSLHSEARFGNGLLVLEYSASGKDALTLAADGISLGEIPFFQTALSARAGGLLKSSGHLIRGAKGVNGELRLEVSQLELSGVKLGAFALPDVRRLASQGMVKVTDGRARLESFTLQGDGIYMRLSGDVPQGAQAANAPLNLMLDIMPKPEFLDSQKLVFLLLAKFMVSPGVYRVPIRGTLVKPEII